MYLTLFNLLFNYFIFIFTTINMKQIKYGDWGLGIGDWGLGIGPNPQSPIPNPQSPIPIKLFHLEFNLVIKLILIIKFK
jgi:hypothetical protein